MNTGGWINSCRRSGKTQANWLICWILWEIKKEQKRKTEFYKIHPELQKLDEKLTSLAISTSLALINKNSREKLDELNNNIKKIK